MGQHDKTTDVSGSDDSFREEARRAEARRILEKSVGELNFGEKLTIWRRREGLSQRQAALRYGIGRNKYSELEKVENSKCLPAPHIEILYSYEMCYILRKRSAWTIADCADQIGVSRYWYNLMELGKASPERLVQYWIENEG